MRQLTSLDHQFLALENDRQTGHVAGLAFLDPSTRDDGSLSCPDIKALLLERLPQLPPLRWRLAHVPMDLDYPYWVDDADFDLDYHVRELALPKPGTDKQLADQTSRIISRHLDRDRPLWELYLIHGHESGNVVMLTKIHHALIDGMSGAEIMGLLLDLGPDAPGRPEATPWKGEADVEPSNREMLARAALGLPKYPARFLRAVPRTAQHIEDTPFGNLPGAGTVGGAARTAAKLIGRARHTNCPDLNAPRVSFSGRISPHRRFAFGRLPLDDVKAAKNLHGTTVNDVVVSVCAGAIRRWLVAHDELPADPLIAQVPVSVRTVDEIGTYGNKILLMAAPLFTNEEDPVARLMQTHEALGDMKERHKALPAGLLQDANHFIPPAVFHRAAQLTFRLSSGSIGRPTWNAVVSNVPGPQIPLYCAGAKLVANHPVSVITDGMGLNITVMSYCGMLDFGLVADRDQMPDLWKVMGWLGDELEALTPTEGRDDGGAEADAGAAGRAALREG